MIHTEAFQQYVHSPAFLDPLGLPPGTDIPFASLGQGEYNANFRFRHPATGQDLVLRVNTGSQMHLPDQIAYEFFALTDLLPTGRTPRPLFYDDSRAILPYGALVMTWLPGRHLRYEEDMGAAAEILADIHALPVPENTRLLRPDRPAESIYQECLDMAGRYLAWEGADKTARRLLEALIREVGRLPLGEPSPAPPAIVSTELNSGNFLINPGERSYLVDWEKPLVSEPAQDLGHFLAPTTTFWKTDVILSPADIGDFLRRYATAVGGRFDLRSLAERLPLYFTVTCLRGVSWCAMAAVEYAQPGRVLTNADTQVKLGQYLSEDFLKNILETYVRRDFLRGVAL